MIVCVEQRHDEGLGAAIRSACAIARDEGKLRPVVSSESLGDLIMYQGTSLGVVGYRLVVEVASGQRCDEATHIDSEIICCWVIKDVERSVVGEMQ